MSYASKLTAIRQLAERPGTEAEGIVARAMLAKFQANNPEPVSNEPYGLFRDFLRSGNLDDLNRACGYSVVVKCACGDVLPCSVFCVSPKHEQLRAEILKRFPIGTRVYYSAWAYQLNCPGTIIGTQRPTDKNWNWYSVKFDHLKNSRSVPVITTEGGRLSTEPITEEEAMPLGWRK